MPAEPVAGELQRPTVLRSCSSGADAFAFRRLKCFILTLTPMKVWLRSCVTLSARASRCGIGLDSGERGLGLSRCRHAPPRETGSRAVRSTHTGTGRDQVFAFACCGSEVVCVVQSPVLAGTDLRSLRWFGERLGILLPTCSWVKSCPAGAGRAFCAPLCSSVLCVVSNLSKRPVWKASVVAFRLEVGMMFHAPAALGVSRYGNADQGKSPPDLRGTSFSSVGHYCFLRLSLWVLESRCCPCCSVYKVTFVRDAANNAGTVPLSCNSLALIIFPCVLRMLERTEHVFTSCFFLVPRASVV